MDWMLKNWQWLLAGFYVAEKIVKLTPTKYDDIVVDVFWNAIRKVTGRSTETFSLFQMIEYCCF